MIIYKITNSNNGKRYVGRSLKPLAVRWYEHCWSADNDSNYHFHKAIRKYGKEIFITEILEEVTSEELLNDREIYWIRHFDTFNNGYNSTLGGLTISGYKHKEETKSIIRSKNIGNKNGIGNKGNKGKTPWNKGKTGLQIAWNKGQKWDEETKKKMRKPKKEGTSKKLSLLRKNKKRGSYKKNIRNAI